MNTEHQITKTEKLIIQLIAFEFTNPEISKALYISKHTVETHRANLMQKLGARNVAGIVRIAIEKNLLGSKYDLVQHPRLQTQNISFGKQW